MNKYITNFAKGCFHHWSVSKAVMELVQNFLDSDGEQDYSFGDDYLSLTNKNIKVSNKLLMMGKSDKRDDPSKRGQFGVGSIQAMVVLTDLDVTVEILNNDVKWQPEFVWDDKFQDYIMVINETPCNNGNNFTVNISGLSALDIDEIKQRCLVFQDREVLYTTQYGQIIGNETSDHQGEIYCGDIFVCQNTKFKYSYNFKPKALTLSQDRNAASEWDLQDLAAKMIIATKDVDFITESMKHSSVDTAGINGWYTVPDKSTPSDVDDKLAQEFIKEHGVTLVTSSFSDYEEKKALGNKITYINNEGICKAIARSSVYREAVAELEVIDKKPFRELMYDLLDFLSDYDYDHKGFLSGDTEVLCDEIRKRVDNSDFE